MNIKYFYRLLVIIFIITSVSYCQNHPVEAKESSITINKTIRNAKAMIKDRKFSKALALLSKIPEHNRDYRVSFLMGSSMVYLNQHEGALVHLERAITLIKQSDKNYTQEKAKLHTIIGHTYQKLGKFDLSLKNHSITAKLLKENVITWVNLGNIYLERKEYDKAMGSFKKAQKIDPTHSLVFFGLANTSYYTKNYDKAIKLFNKLINLRPYFHRGYIGLAKTFMKINKEVEGYTMFAKGYFIAKRYLKALESIERISAFRKNKELLKLYIAVLTEGAMYPKGKSEAIKAIKRFPKESEFIYDLSQIYFRQKQYKSALKVSLSGIKVFKNSHPLHVVAANSYFKLKEGDLAIKYFERVLELEPRDTRSREILAQIYRRNEKTKDLEFFHQGVVYYYVNDLKQAETVFNWIGTTNKKAELKYYKGMIYGKLNKINDAIKYLEGAIKEKQSFYLPYIALARIYESIKQKDKSIKLVKHYINNYPKSIHLGRVRSYYRELISK